MQEPTDDPPRFHVILVEPKYGGNVGAVARAMANFGLDSLILVNPCELNDECRTRAMHAYDIVLNARIYDNFTEAIKAMDHLAATSSIDYQNDKKYLRQPMELEEFSDEIFNISGDIGLLFGREDYGLYNEELACCDVMIKIPTSDIYPVLNLSHAVSTVLYSLYLRTHEPRKRRLINDNEKELLNQSFSDILEHINYPEHKKANTRMLFRRLLGRALPSTWEYHTLMGVFQEIKKRVIRSSDRDNHDED